MALFKPFRGNRVSLGEQPLHDGYGYFCIDDGTFHIDYVDKNGVLSRKQINAKDAETFGGYTSDEFLLKFVGQKTEDSGEIFNTYEDVVVDGIEVKRNQAITPLAHAEGAGTIAGCKAFVIKGSRNVELDAPIDETIPESNVVGIYTLDSVDGIEIGDEFSIQYNSNYDCWGTVIAIGPSESFDLAENEIAAYGAVPNDSYYSYEKNGDPELWFYTKPTIGTIPWGAGQHAEGEGTKAIGPQAHAEGKDTVASGKFSHAEGKETLAVYCSHAEGRGTQAIGEVSHAEGSKSVASGFAAHASGTNTKAIGNKSYAGGSGSIANGESSFAHGTSCETNGVASFTTGRGVVTESSYQAAMGSYNEPREDAYLIVGNGTSKNSRSNAFVVAKDGSAELSKQGMSDNSVVIKDTLNKVVEQCGVYEETTSNNTLIVHPEIRGDHIISTSNTGSIRKFGTNLLRTRKDAGKEIFNYKGIVATADAERSGILIDGACTATVWALQPYYYVSYFPAGHYTFFVEGLDTVHTAEKVYIVLKGKETVDSDQEVTLTRIDSTAPVVEFDIDQGVAALKVQVVIKAGETFENEHIRFQLQAGSKTDFVPYKHFTTIEMEAGKEVVIQIDDLTPFTLIAQTEGNTITCKYPISTKKYVDTQLELLKDYLINILCKHDYTSVVTPPTCTDDGYTTHTCSICGRTYRDSITAALGGNHSWVEATSTAPKTCSKCGLTSGEPLPRAWELTDDGVLHIYDASLVEADYFQDVPPWFDVQDSFHNISFEDNITSIGQNAFSMSALTSLTLPRGVTSIGSYAFDACENLTEVILPDTLVSIGDQVFSNCPSLTEITIPNGVVSIGQQAFANCPITELIIPSSVTSLGFESFLCCDSLITVTIPTSVTRLNDTFMGCLALEEINYAGTMEQWNSMELSGGWYDGELVAYVTCSDGKICIGEHFLEWEEHGDVHRIVCIECDAKLGEEPHVWSDEVIGAADDLTHFKSCGYCTAQLSIPHTVESWTKTFNEDGTVCTLEGDCIAENCGAWAVHTHIKGETIDCPYCDEVIQWPCQVCHEYPCVCEDPEPDNPEPDVPECQHTNTETINATEPTCTEAGYSGDTYCDDCESTIEYGEAVPATGHDTTSHDAKAATCTGIGWNAYETCSKCDYTTYKEIPALGHDEVDHDAKAATCTEKGWNAYVTCSKCDYTTYEEIPALGHTEVVDNAVEPTCTKTGLTEGKHCSVCNAVLVEQKEVEALGHDYIEDDTCAEATCTEDGWLHYECSRCADSYDDVIEKATGHNWVLFDEDLLEYHCSNCGAVEYGDPA